MDDFAALLMLSNAFPSTSKKKEESDPVKRPISESHLSETPAFKYSQPKEYRKIVMPGSPAKTFLLEKETSSASAATVPLSRQVRTISQPRAPGKATFVPPSRSVRIFSKPNDSSTAASVPLSRPVGIFSQSKKPANAKFVSPSRPVDIFSQLEVPAKATTVLPSRPVSGFSQTKESAKATFVPPCRPVGTISQHSEIKKAITPSRTVATFSSIKEPAKASSPVGIFSEVKETENSTYELSFPPAGMVSQSKQAKRVTFTPPVPVMDKVLEPRESKQATSAPPDPPMRIISQPEECKKAAFVTPGPSTGLFSQPKAHEKTTCTSQNGSSTAFFTTDMKEDGKVFTDELVLQNESFASLPSSPKFMENCSDSDFLNNKHVCVEEPSSKISQLQRNDDFFSPSAIKKPEKLNSKGVSSLLRENKEEDNFSEEFAVRDESFSAFPSPSKLKEYRSDNDYPNKRYDSIQESSPKQCLQYEDEFYSPSTFDQQEVLPLNSEAECLGSSTNWHPRENEGENYCSYELSFQNDSSTSLPESSTIMEVCNEGEFSGEKYYSTEELTPQTSLVHDDEVFPQFTSKQPHLEYFGSKGTSAELLANEKENEEIEFLGEFDLQDADFPSPPASPTPTEFSSGNKFAGKRYNDMQASTSQFYQVSDDETFSHSTSQRKDVRPFGLKGKTSSTSSYGLDKEVYELNDQSTTENMRSVTGRQTTGFRGRGGFAWKTSIVKPMVRGSPYPSKAQVTQYNNPRWSGSSNISSTASSSTFRKASEIMDSRMKLVSVKEIPAKYRSIFSCFPYFNIVQSTVFEDVLKTDKTLVVCAPTGAGKTVIFELAIVRLLMKMNEMHPESSDYKIVYMAPVKSLCNERFEDWKKKFSPLGVYSILLTGDSDMENYFELQRFSIIITTPEKWDSMTRRWKDNTALVQMVKLFMIDEVHLLNEEERGATMEATLSRMKTIQTTLSRKAAEKDTPMEKLRFVAVSATFPNAADFSYENFVKMFLTQRHITFPNSLILVMLPVSQKKECILRRQRNCSNYEVTEWLRYPEGDGCTHKLSEDLRPVKLKKIVLGYCCPANWSEFKFDLFLSYKLGNVIRMYSEWKPTLVFCSTRKSVVHTSTVLAKETKFVINSVHKQALLKVANLIRDSKLRDTLKNGVGFHHAGLELYDRKQVEELFLKGELPVLVSTSTLAMGVNFPAHLVVVKSTAHYVSGAYTEYSGIQLLQMMGRAGRPQFDNSATAVIMTKQSLKERYQGVVHGTQLIESSLHKHLSEHLNAEIVLRTLNDVSVAMEWIRSTFLYIRALKNPKHYGIKADLPKELIEKKLHDMCVIEINGLAKYKLVSMDDDCFVLKPTETGRLMAKYYTAYETMKHFCTLRGNESLADLISVISGCKEFEEIQLRVSEKKCLNDLNVNKNKATVRYPLNGRIKNTSMKINCLIQAAFGCLPIQDPQLNQDVSKVIRMGSRLSKCLSECIRVENKGYRATWNAAILAKCFNARLWENSKHVSRQLDKIGVTLSNVLVGAGITSFKRIKDANPRELEMILNRHPPFGNTLHEAVKHLPTYEVEIAQSPNHSPNAATLTFTVQMTNFLDLLEKRTADDNHSCLLIVGDAANNVFLNQRVMDATLLKSGHWSRKLEVTKCHGNSEIYVHYISEKYVGFDIRLTYQPYYLSNLHIDGQRLQTSCSKMNSEAQLSSQPSTSTRGSVKLSQSSSKTKRACNHRCLNKFTCSHECCKSGVTVSNKDTPRMSLMTDYLVKLHSRSSSEPAKRLKISTPGALGDTVSLSDLTKRFSYIPKEKYKAEDVKKVEVGKVDNVSNSYDDGVEAVYETPEANAHADTWEGDEEDAEYENYYANVTDENEDLMDFYSAQDPSTLLEDETQLTEVVSRNFQTLPSKEKSDEHASSQSYQRPMSDWITSNETTLEPSHPSDTEGFYNSQISSWYGCSSADKQPYGKNASDRSSNSNISSMYFAEDADSFEDVVEQEYEEKKENVRPPETKHKTPQKKSRNSSDACVPSQENYYLTDVPDETESIKNSSFSEWLSNYVDKMQKDTLNKYGALDDKSHVSENSFFEEDILHNLQSQIAEEENRYFEEQFAKLGEKVCTTNSRESDDPKNDEVIPSSLVGEGEPKKDCSKEKRVIHRLPRYSTAEFSEKVKEIVSRCTAASTYSSDDEKSDDEQSNECLKDEHMMNERHQLALEKEVSRKHLEAEDMYRRFSDAFL